MNPKRSHQRRSPARSVALLSAAAIIVLAAGEPARAQVAILPALPRPLTLPPGLVEVLPLDKTGSIMGDAIRVVDCAADEDLPEGTCGNQFFGGLALADSHLSGALRIQFYPPVGDISHFQVSYGVLNGEDTVMQAPQGFEMPFLNVRVSDAGLLAEGDLELTTGGVTNVNFNASFSHSVLDALLNVNPNVARPIVAFPGTHGFAWARFEQREDGLLDFSFRGSTFLPLGKAAQGDLIRWPLALCNSQNQCASVIARGTSLHPRLDLSTKAPAGPECGANCPDIPSNAVQLFTLFSHSSSMGDNFNLDIPALGGGSPGRTHLAGRVQIQFGPRSGDTVPFAVTGLVPEGLLAAPPSAPLPGLVSGLIGQNNIVAFPSGIDYLELGVVFLDDPLDLPHGAIDLKTGRVIGEMAYPGYFVFNLIEQVLYQNDGRIALAPFPFVAMKPVGGAAEDTYALFERGVNGETLFRYSGKHKRSFAGFRWPSPDYIKANSFIGGPDASLDIFIALQAIHAADTPVARKTGAAGNLLSSLGDHFSYGYSVPCDLSGAFDFLYTNDNRGSSGGTFRMKSLASVQCINSRASKMSPGDYDTVTFSGFGTWSKDAADATPRFAWAQISTAPEFPYVSIIVFQNPDADGNLMVSGVHTKPAEKPLP